MSVEQTGNTASRDVIAGSKYETYYVAAPTPLSRLYQILRDADRDAPYTSHIAHQLQHYCATTTSSDVRGLVDKLTASGRTDIISAASQWKEMAAKLIMRWQTSPVAQDILTHILAKLHAEFTLHAQPAIQAGRCREEVDQLVSDKVIGPTHTMLGDNDLSLTHIDLLGLLFFLGGNCHIRWDKC